LTQPGSEAQGAAAAFLLIKTNVNAYEVLRAIGGERRVLWAAAAYGPWQVVAYATATDHAELTEFIENLRVQDTVQELDARMCKGIPGDDQLPDLLPGRSAEMAVLLVNVDYEEETERNVTYNLRKVQGMRLARAMWGPADIIALVEGATQESLRNTICDEVKTMRGVRANTTLYCYPIPAAGPESAARAGRVGASTSDQLS
jgi:hypothetical protein